MLVQRVVCDHQVDETPPLERRGVVAPPEHRDLLGAHCTSALHLPLNAAEQRVQAERNLDRADLCRTRRDDVIAGQRQLEAAAEADPVHARNDWDRQQFEQLQKVDAADRRLAPAALLNARTEQSDVGAGGEVAQPTAQDDGPAAGLLGPGDLGRDRTDQGRAELIIRPVLHGEDRDQPSFLASNDDIIHDHPPLQLAALTSTPLRLASC